MSTRKQKREKEKGQKKEMILGSIPIAANRLWLIPL
jgi:hypothetical protein